MKVPFRKLRAAAVLTAAAALSGCFFQPGTFDATLHLQQDRQFAFEYQGEIIMAGLSDLADMAAEAEGKKTCLGDNGEQRPCTDEELAEQARNDEMGRAMMESMLVGTDLSDPESVEELTEMLERQAGWNSVEFTGDGTFVVDFSITSTLSHDFDFPTFESMPMANSFIQLRLRDEGRARIDAPGFAPTAGNPMSAMMLGMFGAFAEMDDEDGNGESLPDMRPPEGTFRIVTDARILANNTDEGPETVPAGQMLTWEVGPGTLSAPSALLQFGG